MPTKNWRRCSSNSGYNLTTINVSTESISIPVQNPRLEQLDLVALRDLGEIVTGTTPSTAVPAYFDGPFQFITPGDIGDSKFVQHTARHLSEEGLRVCRELPKNS